MRTLTLLTILTLPLAAATPEEAFESRIRPLLIERCHACHGEAAMSGLRLDSREGALAGGSRGAAIVLGDPGASLLIEAVRHEHKTLAMPPTGKLKEAQIADLERWIADGAVWPLSPREQFVSQVQPILEQRCVSCHGEKPLGGLGLDSAEAFAKGGKSGPAVLAGDPDSSLLIRSIRREPGSLPMPPTGKLADEEIATLERWVEAGAFWPTGGAPGGFEINDEERSFWSFQPVSKSAPPPGADHPIDAFIRARLAETGLKPADRADKRTLIRRASYDLTGLPPTPEEVEAFLADGSPDAFAKVVDHLLASPAYGERWGRHWMDVVRYADTAGDSADYPIPQIRHYRDYIIRSFNEDKPYDRFVREQLAGDLLPAANDDERWQNVVATGYLANTRRFDVLPERSMHLTYEDAIDNIGKAFLGLSVNCARCHDHKFDPISQADYYGLFGILDSTAWPYAGSERRRGQWNLTWREHGAYEAWGEPVRAEWEKLNAELTPLVARTDAFYLDPAAVEDKEWSARNSDEYARVLELFKERRKLIEQLPAPPEAAYALFERGPRDAPIHLRGEPDKRGKIVPRRFLEILGGQTLQDPQESGRRELADWIVDPQNPLTARVMANRIWQHHFGRGLVASPNDFGVRGEAPTDPELLDWLAARFVEEGWSIKAMHRLMMLSETWMQSSAPNRAAVDVDPDNKLLWRWSRRRLAAEELRDSLLLLSGGLKLGPAEEHPFPTQDTWDYTQHKPYQAEYETDRRSVYLMTQRIQKHPYLSLFDGPDPNATTPLRRLATNPIQSLFLMNSELVHESSLQMARRLLDAGGEPMAQAHLLLLGTPASEADTAKAGEYLAQAQIAMGKAGLPEAEHRRQALASYLRVLMASNAFLHVD